MDKYICSKCHKLCYKIYTNNGNVLSNRLSPASSCCISNIFAIRPDAQYFTKQEIEAARQEGAEDAVMKSGIMQLKIDSAVSIARQEEREAIIEIVKRFIVPEEASTVIHAIRKRGEKPPPRHRKGHG